MMVTFRDFQRIHMVGIGGIGMSGIAEVLLTLGYSVSGSDTRLSPITERLQDLGAGISEGHKAGNVEGAHVVVISSAIKPDNPEVLEAHRSKIPVIPRAEMLAELMRLKYGIAVAGAHGKTTTTSLVASVLAAAHLDPTFVVGGRVNQAGTTARLGRGEYFVVEADESDRTFLLLAPVVAVVTTIDREHLDQYASLKDIQEAFTQFVNRVPFYGATILCLDEPNVQAIIPSVKRPIITYGTSSQADLVISDIELKGLRSEFRLTYKGDDLGLFHLPAPPGIHNVRNAAAAAAVALYLNVPAELIREGLAKFSGVGRRFEIKGVINDITVIDDYGHHPAEIRATLDAARGCKFNRLLVLFQPHRFTRTQHLWDDFCRAFNQADLLLLTDIYAASEAPIHGVTSEALARAIREAGHKNVVYLGSLREAIEHMLREARPGDAVMSIGAGNVSRAGNELTALLGAELQKVQSALKPDETR
ncbi:MAG TPA: UDP-N-acetylmuramate--L-alanine ligase [Candidatus Acidoferrales bacterium]|nr:UDP-N-acetylmuramate--L-alanine ligase [Candidatus Acidoferrales bacterium]